MELSSTVCMYCTYVLTCSGGVPLLVLFVLADLPDGDGGEPPLLPPLPPLPVAPRTNIQHCMCCIVHICMHIHIHIIIHVCMYIFSHVYTHTYIHTHIHTCSPVYATSSSRFPSRLRPNPHALGGLSQASFNPGQ